MSLGSFGQNSLCFTEKDIPIPADICWPELKIMGVMAFLVLAINAFL